MFCRLIHSSIWEINTDSKCTKDVIYYHCQFYANGLTCDAIGEPICIKSTREINIAIHTNTSNKTHHKLHVTHCKQTIQNVRIALKMCNTSSLRKIKTHS